MPTAEESTLPDNRSTATEVEPGGDHLWREIYNQAHEDTDSAPGLHAQLSRLGERYEDRGLIAKGGYKRIELVFDARTGRELAMARLRGDFEKAQVEAFLREARITAALNHPNIIPVHDIGVDEEGDPFFTMKLLGEHTLGSILRRGEEEEASPLATRLDWFLKICDAVAFAHSLGILHMDLKPENIQISEFGEVLVCDWGLARLVHVKDQQDELLEDPAFFRTELEAVTLRGQLKGTPGYMAPEQAEARNSSKNERTDIFSLGAILYALLTGKTPITGQSADDVVRDTIEGRWVRPRRRRPDLRIPRGLEAVVMKAMSRHPSGRYRSVAELILDIHAYRAGFPTSAQNANLLERMALFYQRRRTFCRVLATTTVLFLVSSIIYLDSAYEHRQELRFEQSKRQRMNYAAELLFQGHHAFLDGRTAEAEALIDQSLMLHPLLKPAREIKGHFYLGRHQVQPALKAYRIAESEGWVRQAEFVGEQPRDPHGVFESHIVAAILQNAGELSSSPAFTLFLQTQAGSLLTNVERFDLIKKVLQHDNPDLTELHFEIHPVTGGLALDLSGNDGLANLRVLSGHPIKELNLSGANLTSLDHLKRLPLEVLHLDGNPHLHQLAALSGLPLHHLDLRNTHPVLDDLHGSRVKELDLRGAKFQPKELVTLLESTPIEKVYVDLEMHGLKEALEGTDNGLKSRVIRAGKEWDVHSNTPDTSPAYHTQLTKPVPRVRIDTQHFHAPDASLPLQTATTL